MIERLEGHERPLVDVEREVLVIRVANELEEGLDNSLVYCPPGMRDDTLKKLALSAALARLLARNSLRRADRRRGEGLRGHRP